MFSTPAWQSPDEYAHYWVAEQIATTGDLPMSQPNDFSYEAYQPPLYYLVAAGVLLLPHDPMAFSTSPHPPSGMLLLLRLVSVACGVGILIFSKKLFTNLKWLNHSEILSCTAFVAFLPTFVGLTSTVNNDSPAILLATISLHFMLGNPISNKEAWLAGLSAGLALLCKLNAVLVLPVIGLYLLIYKRKDKLIRISLLFISGFAVGASVLLLRNWQQYHTLLALTPGVERGFYFSWTHLLLSLRNLAWSFWLAYGRTYQISAPAIVYFVTALPVMAAAGFGWLRIVRAQRALFWFITLPLLIGVLISLSFTLSYPPGLQTSWGKNLYPLLALLAIFFVLGIKNVLPKKQNLVHGFLIGWLLCGCAWGWWRLINL